MFRRVILPEQIKGTLYVHSMPGRFEPFEAAVKESKSLGINRVACLATKYEIRDKSPDYAQAIQQSALPWRHEAFPVPDLKVPADQEAFLALAKKLADGLRQGEKILVHCSAGVGRTGMLATAILLSLGLPFVDAENAILNAGSGAETTSQKEFLRWVAEKVGNPSTG